MYIHSNMHRIAVALFLLCSMISEIDGAIECYSCTYSTQLSSDPVGNSVCATSPTSSPKTSSVSQFGCQTTYKYNPDGTYTISRDVMTNSVSATAGFASYCTSGSSSNSAWGSTMTTTCYCSSNNCNSEAIKFPSTVQCYECTSSHYFDNGCGDKVDEGSSFVRKASGCRSCYKYVDIDTDKAVSYHRGCLRTANFKEGCDKTENPTFTIYCGCDNKDFCNSAHRISNTSSICLMAVLSAALYKLFY